MKLAADEFMALAELAAPNGIGHAYKVVSQPKDAVEFVNSVRECVVGEGARLTLHKLQHEVNGLLVEPDSVRDLAAALRRLIDEPTLLAGLAAHPMPVKTIEQDAAEWAGVYADVLASTAVMA